jgi:AAA domain, putative AbiEii toxin, Type IV TA system
VIRRVVIKGFKRFTDITFDLPGHVVIAGPNNSGKTTLLQAIAAWDLTIRVWKQLNNFHRRGGGYQYAPISRQAFSAVPLRQYDLLWNERQTDKPIEITLTFDGGKSIAMELFHDTTEQIKVHPKSTVETAVLLSTALSAVFVPPMTGLARDEPLYARDETIDNLLAQGRPGEVLQNLLVKAHQSATWGLLLDAIKRLFNYELLPPVIGANIISEYKRADSDTRYDVASAGSGFQQVLMLLTFLHTRPGSVLLLDEPDAHLHVILQDAIYSELRSVAADTQSQLIIATHSEVIIESVDPRELCLMYGTPRLLSDNNERALLIQSLGTLTHTDIMLAETAPGVFYVDDYTDMDVLRAWARVLAHPVLEILTTQLLWKARVIQQREGAKGIQAKDHYDALQLVKPGLPGLQLPDGDAHPGQLQTPITGDGLQRLRWTRYEIESYLFHPVALARFVTRQVGEAAAAQHIGDMAQYMSDKLPPAILRNPLGDDEFLNPVKARSRLIVPILEAAGLAGFPYTRYHEIAALMKPEEIHPEVKEKLDAIQKAFKL